MQRALVLAALWSAPVVSAGVTSVATISSCPTTAPSPIIERVRDGEVVVILTEDGLKLTGTFYAPRKSKTTDTAPAVLLVHDAGGNRGQMESIATRLQKTGFGVLTVDLRGHGDSTTDDLDWKSMDEQTRTRLWQLAPRDLEASAEWLLRQKGVHATRLSLVGYRAGCALVARHAESDENVIGMVLLAPKAQDMGFDVEKTIHNISGLPTCVLDKKNDATTRLVTEANASYGEEWVAYLAVPSKRATVLDDSKTASKISSWLGDIALPQKGRR